MPAENALSLDWQDQPYDKLVAEAKRVGAFDGPGTHSTGTWHSATCPTPESPARCACVHEADGVWIWIRDGMGTAVRVWFPTPGVNVRASKVATVCPFHKGIPDPTEHMETLIAECTLLIRFETRVLSLQGAADLKLPWVFNPQRQLVIDASKVEAAIETGIQDLAATTEFAGKVIVNG